MEVNSAPGPDGLPVGFYREFWAELKPLVLEMFNDFFRGELNLSRQNYGMISLIPKIKEANNIKQYRPICLLNVDYKWFTKALTLRLTPWAAKLISETQTAFIPGRYILEGVVILHEVLHELRVNNLSGIILKLDFEKAYDKVQWSFMMEVLKGKNFPPKWLEWMKQIIEGGKVGININGEDGQFFNTYKGLRQGDPLSPLLFNLVSDALATMFENAKLTGQIRGLVPNLIEGGLTHLQYADDTIVFLNHDDQSVYNAKFLLYCFENMSGLKINYEKSEVFVLSCSDEEQNRVAAMFDCNNGSLPLKYLGIMVDNKHMSASDLSYIHLKVEKRIPTWQSVGLSSGGKMVLIESCLSSIPTYTMGIYHLQEEIHQKMDTARANFFWHGPHQKRKYHMAKWRVMASPKKVGGAGFTDTRVMNKCLLAKWLVKLERGDTTLCCNLLRQKYLGENSIYSYKKKSGSQFWRGMLSIRDEVARGLVYTIGNRKKARFWLDVWIGSCPLCISFPNLFDICNQKEWSVFKTQRNGSINLTFRRNFRDEHDQEWAALSGQVEETSLNNIPDSVTWCLERKGIFTTASLYNAMFFSGYENKWMMCIWEAKIPLKIKIFLWQVCNDKI
jgi:hypothetical protein